MSKKCPKGCMSIERCLTKKKKLIIKSPKIVKVKKEIKKKLVVNPLLSKYRKICDSGLVTQKKINPLLTEVSSKIGEFFDVYCVSNNNKPLAALDFSTYGKKFLKKLDINLLNKVIDFANYKGVQYIHNKKIGGMYLKSVFFLPKNYKNALKLMYILWYGNNFNNTQYQISIGLLLGYDIENIIFFLKTNFDTTITKNDIKLVKSELDNLNITLEDLQKNYKIVIETSIKNL